MKRLQGHLTILDSVTVQTVKFHNKESRTTVRRVWEP